MSQLCFACQTATSSRERVCPNCGRNLGECRQQWSRGSQQWRAYLEQTGWYPGRYDEWSAVRWSTMIDEPPARPSPPRRLTVYFLGGHPQLVRTGRVALVRGGDQITMRWLGWWPMRPAPVTIPLDSVRSVTSQRTVESSLDEAVMTAAIGGARTGPIGVALGTAIGKRRRTVRTVHVQHDCMGERIELIFRPLEEYGEAGIGALMRIFANDHPR